jgi:hypothetical protein
MRPDPAADEGLYGSWIADVERPAPQNRSGYQPHLDEARQLVAGRCAAPAQDDVQAPRLRIRIAARQHARAAGGIQIGVRCPDADCLSGAMATVTAGGRERIVRAAAIEPPGTRYGTLLVRLPRIVRRELARGHGVRARVTVCAADAAANAGSRERPVLLLP